MQKCDVDSNNHLYLLQYANPKPSLSRHYSRAISGSFVAMISLWFLNWLLSLVFTIRVGYSLVHSWSFLVAVGLCLVLIWHWIFLSILITVNRKYFPTALPNSKIHADINSSGKLRQINLFLIMSCMVLGLTATMFWHMNWSQLVANTGFGISRSAIVWYLLISSLIFLAVIIVVINYGLLIKWFHYNYSCISLTATTTKLADDDSHTLLHIPTNRWILYLNKIVKHLCSRIYQTMVNTRHTFLVKRFHKSTLWAASSIFSL